MTAPNDGPTLDEVLEHRTELERQAVGSDDADPSGAHEHTATD